MATAPRPALDMDKLNAFVGRFVGDLGAAVHTGMVVIGERLGLYKALADAPMSSAELAAKTQTDERYVREWLASQAAGGYVTYDEGTDKFSLNAEQSFTLANEDSPAYLPGRLNSLWPRWKRSHASPTLFALAREWAGTSMPKVFFTGARNSFVPATRRIW